MRFLKLKHCKNKPAPSHLERMRNSGRDEDSGWNRSDEYVIQNVTFAAEFGVILCY